MSVIINMIIYPHGRGFLMQKKRLGELLIAENIITKEQLEEALVKQKQMGLKLGEYLEKVGILTEEVLIQTLKKQLNLRFIDLSKIHIQDDIINMLPEELAQKYEVLPISVENGKMLLAMKDPLDYYAMEDIRVLVGLRVIPALTYRETLSQAIKKYYGRSVAEKALTEFVKNNQRNVKEEVENIEQDNAPIMKFINSVIENAIRNKASDIHIEPDMDELRIRYRIDGVLRQSMTTSIDTANSIASRIKIMARLKITEKRKPQDGRAVYEVDGRRVDLRISTLPIGDFEKIVIRILDKQSFQLERSNLGLNQAEDQKYEEMIKKPNGIVLVTGPTGSGKTSTLYTMLSELNSVEKNIVTVEDPIEFHFKGMNQVQINPAVGLTFAEGLRSILRQDPDIVMVGEIRDKETAEIGIRAALTGHLVLSTLHTNDSISTISRLIDMGIEPFLISSTLSGIIAQRLIRKVCPECSHEYEASEGEKSMLKYSHSESLTLVKGKGCDLCNHSGYKGRTAIFEMLSIDNELKGLIENGAKYSELQNYIDNSTIDTLKDNAIKLVLDKSTTLEEMIRVTYL